MQTPRMKSNQWLPAVGPKTITPHKATTLSKLPPSLRKMWRRIDEICCLSYSFRSATSRPSWASTSERWKQATKSYFNNRNIRNIAHVIGEQTRRQGGDQNVNAIAATSRALAANIRIATASLRITVVAIIADHPPSSGELTKRRVVPGRTKIGRVSLFLQEPRLQATLRSSGRRFCVRGGLGPAQALVAEARYSAASDMPKSR
jgi:hypothetical protein